jgi:hypothetical protein
MIPHTPSPDPSRCGSDWACEDKRMLTKKKKKGFEAVPNEENVVYRNVTNFEAAQF